MWCCQSFAKAAIISHFTEKTAEQHAALWTDKAAMGFCSVQSLISHPMMTETGRGGAHKECDGRRNSTQAQTRNERQGKGLLFAS